MRLDLRNKRVLVGLAVALTVVGLLLIAVPLVVLAVSSPSANATQAGTASALVAVPTSTSVASDAATSVVASGTSVASDVSAEPTPAAPVTDTPYVEPTPTPPSTPAVAPAPTAATAAVASIDAYRGLGSWVDIYDAKAWKDPAAAVADMAGHGVRTLFLETSNSRSSFTIKNTAGASTFIREAHARGMKVVAWYLPDMKNGSTDYDRIAAAIGFRTSDGQKFDSFALDIESSAIKSESARNSALASLSADELLHVPHEDRLRCLRRH